MVDAKRITRRTALGLVAGGTLLAGSKTFGFSNATATRGSNVDQASDQNALLGIEGTDDTSVTPTFTNNAGYAMDLDLDSTDSIEFDVGDNGNWTTPPVTLSLATGESGVVNFRFTGDCADAGTATIDADATLLDGGGGTVGFISLSRDFEIPQSGQVQFEGNANSAGASGKYEFELVNTGCADVTFDGIGINETTTNADYVSGGGSLSNVDTGDTLVTDQIPIDNSDPTSDTRRDMTPNLPLAQDDAATLEFDRFEQSGGGKPGVDMRDQDVRITLYFGDGSSATLQLCLGTCDF